MIAKIKALRDSVVDIKTMEDLGYKDTHKGRTEGEVVFGKDDMYIAIYPQKNHYVVENGYITNELHQAIMLKMEELQND